MADASNAESRDRGRDRAPGTAGADGQDLLLSYLAVRQALGLLGLSLPASLLVYAYLFKGGMQPSISDFYHTSMGDWLVGTLSAIGVFLFAYKGYATRPSRLWLGDREMSRIAGGSAIGVALFPISAEPAQALCRLGETVGRCADLLQGPGAMAVSGFTWHGDALHLGFALIFFLCLAYFSLVLFPMGGARTAQGKPAPTPEHRIYRICGLVILAALVAIVAYVAGLDDAVPALRSANALFWAETVAVVAFSISWLTKGKFLRRPFGLRAG